MPNPESLTQRGHLTSCGERRLPVPPPLAPSSSGEQAYILRNRGSKPALLSALHTFLHICPRDTQALVEKIFKVTFRTGGRS